ncbi:MAG: signal peptidase I [Nitrospirota bacterium]|nr:signal peptidase I [Nitrospirota bacterium]
MAEDNDQEEPKRIKSFYKEWVEPFLIAAVVALFIRQFVVEAFKIPSGSMIPTLTIGDHLLVNKFIYGPRIPFTDTRIFSWKEPKRGDVIVFKYPENEDKNFIKRIIGLPGDKIQINSGKLLINNEVVPFEEQGEEKSNDRDNEPFGSPARIGTERLGTMVHLVQFLQDQKDKNFGPVTVPKDSVFVMGDNRDNSQDSRIWGFVKYEKILGRALIIYWSWDGNDRWLRWERIGNLIR